MRSFAGPTGTCNQPSRRGSTSQSKLFSSSEGEWDVLLFRGADAPILLCELGRCREVTFRAAGQGVGRDRDVAPEDDYYHHLVVWHRSRGEIIGAYCLGFTREILDRHGPHGLVAPATANTFARTGSSSAKRMRSGCIRRFMVLRRDSQDVPLSLVGVLAGSAVQCHDHDETEENKDHGDHGREPPINGVAKNGEFIGRNGFNRAFAVGRPSLSLIPHRANRQNSTPVSRANGRDTFRGDRDDGLEAREPPLTILRRMNSAMKLPSIPVDPDFMVSVIVRC